MIEIFLIWTLVAGEVREVDAFMSKDACTAAKELWDANLAQVRPLRPDLEHVSFLGCMPAKVEAPPKQEPRKESL